MIEDRKTRILIRRVLIISSIVLTVIAITVTTLGIYSLRSRLISDSSLRKQFYAMDLDTTEAKQEQIKPDRAVVASKNTTQTNDISHPKIAIMLVNLGFNKRATQMAMILPQQVGFGFLPYTTSLKPLMYQAIERGHEIFLYAPFESKNAQVADKLPILSSQNPEVNSANMKRLLSGFTGYKGIYGSFNETFTDDMGNLKSILEFAHNSNLLLVLGARKDSADKLVKNNHDVIFNSMLIDNELTPSAIKQNLQQLIALSKIHGQVVGYAQSYPMTINLLASWIPNLIEEGVELVPISSIQNGN